VTRKGEIRTDYQFPSYINTVNHSQRLEESAAAIHSLKSHVEALSGKQQERVFLIQHGVSAAAREPDSAFTLV